MSEQFIFKDTFWKFLVSLEGLKEKKERIVFCSSLGLDEKEFLEYVDSLEEIDVKVLWDQNYIYPLQNQAKVHIDFSLSEWFALQASIVYREHEGYFQRIIKSKIEVVQKAQDRYQLIKSSQPVFVGSGQLENIRKRLDYFIAQRTIIRVDFHSSKHCELYPHRMVFLDGALSLVGEDTFDKSLIYFPLVEIKQLEEKNSEYQANLSQIEINDFINNLRMVNGTEERIVLKFYSQEGVDFLPAYHFLGNPFVTSNSEGDMIWAATVEMCDDIFRWMYQMRDKVEVLDPGHIRKEFAHYCELKKESPEDKKAS